MTILTALDVLGVSVAGVGLPVVVIAWYRQPTQAPFMAVCWALGCAMLGLSFLVGSPALPVRTDSMDFVRGLCLGLAVGANLGLAPLIRLGAHQPKRA